MKQFTVFFSGRTPCGSVFRRRYSADRQCGELDISGYRHFIIMKDWAISLYKSKRWQQVREYCMTRDHRLCQDCLKKGRYTPAEEVHHIIPLTPLNIDDASISLNPENLVSLCRECHRERHGAHERRYKVDEFGRVTSK